MATHPLTGVLTVSLIIEKDGNILILHERADDGALRLMLPGGHVDLGESVFDAVRREAMEETGLEVEPRALVQVLARTLENGTHAVRQTFIVRVLGGELRAETGVTAVWMTHEEIERADEALFNVGARDAMRSAFAGRSVDPSMFLVRKGQKPEMLTVA